MTLYADVAEPTAIEVPKNRTPDVDPGSAVIESPSSISAGIRQTAGHLAAEKREAELRSRHQDLRLKARALWPGPYDRQFSAEWEALNEEARRLPPDRFRQRRQQIDEELEAIRCEVERIEGKIADARNACSPHRREYSVRLDNALAAPRAEVARKLLAALSEIRGEISWLNEAARIGGAAMLTPNVLALGEVEAFARRWA
jgi:hypothetical protein